MEKYYKTGEFAKMANLSLRTIRYYDHIGLLKPSKIAENGYRLYTDKDVIKLQKILSLKYLGFSLDDIFSMTLNDSYISLQESLSMQRHMIEQKIENLEDIKESLIQTEHYLQQQKEVNWADILKNINFSTMEKDIIQQYKDSTNIDIRIRLHDQYSINPLHWFEWLYSKYHIEKDMHVLEIGCGSGELWQKNRELIPQASIILSDISQGMIKDVQETLGDMKQFQYECFDCHHIPHPSQSFDVVIANHMLFYLKDLHQVLQEIRRVLKPQGVLYCSTYGKNHMKEITELVKEYNPKINLSNMNLYDIFGLENGEEILKEHFESIELKKYDDYLIVDNPDDITNYILSCHGNQMEYILKDSDAFQRFMKRKTLPALKITKDAGMFICRK